MTDPDPLLDAQIRAARYWNVDGLSEVVIGLRALFVPLFLYGLTQTSRGSVGRVAVVLAFAAGLPASSLLSRPLLEAVRRRSTYRRTGFVEYRRDGRPWAFGIVLSLALLLALLGLRAVTAGWVAWLFGLQGAVLGGLVMYFGRLVRLVRLQVAGGLSAAFGLALAVAGPGLVEGMIIYWAGISALFLVSGGLTYRQYTRRHPKTAEAS